MGDWSSRLTLIRYEEKKNARNVLERTGKVFRKTVFCDKGEANQNEFFSAAAAGKKATFRMTIHAWEYSGQEWAEYRGVTYKIYRTHEGKSPDELELYLEEKQGR